MNELERMFEAAQYTTDKGYCGTLGSHGKAPCCQRCIKGLGQGHHYLKFYGMIFEHMRNCGNVVEIGVQRGGSLLMWSNYFQIARVTGIDIHLTDRAKEIEQSHAHIVLIEGDATDPATKDMLPTNIDILIDDGSHKLAHQMISMALLWPSIRRGGWYCIEDIEPRDKARLYDAMRALDPDILLTSDTSTRGGLWNSFVFAAQKGE